MLRGELATDPDNAEYTYMLADALCQEEQFDEARALYRRAHELAPTSSAALYALGSLYASEGDTDRAVEVMREALEVDPMNFTIRKQIWRIEHPDKFYPTIDMKFQVEQIKREGFPDLSKLPVSIRRELAIDGAGDEATAAGHAGAPPAELPS